MNHKKPRGALPVPPAPEAAIQESAGSCPLARKCGGCQLRNMDYPRQLRWKQAQAERLLGRFCRVSPILGMEEPSHYRNKAQAAFAPGRGGIVSGLYQSSSRRVLPMDSCPNQDPLADQIIVTVRRLAKKLGLQPWDPATGRGFLRHVLVRRGFSTGQVMVALVTARPAFPARGELARALVEAHPQITTVVHNICDGPPMVLGERETVLYGPGYIEDKLCGCLFRISAQSFYQVNPLQTQVLYEEALRLAGLGGEETVIDAYCGIGTIGILAAGRGAARVVGVEVNRDAVRDAIRCAKLNGLDNIRFCQGDAGRFMAELAEDGQTVDVVFMDPPRQGSDRAFLTSLAKMAPRRVVYISCNPVTQARDLEFLVRCGYRVTDIRPVDMFPHTNHIECVALLTLRDGGPKCEEEKKPWKK